VLNSRWQGSFTDGRTAALHRVDVAFDGLYLLIRDSATGHEYDRWEVRQVRAETGSGPDAIDLRCEATPDAFLSIASPGVVAAFREIGIGARGLPEGSARRAMIGLAFTAGIAGAVGLVWMGVTPLSRVIAGWVPLEYERALSGEVEEAFSEYHCESEEAATVMAGLVERLAGADHGLPTVHVVNLDLPNAFAMPGGGVLFTRGLLETAESPDEVAGVLAHEIQHVEQRHVMTSIVRGGLLSSIWAVTIGDYSGLLVIDPTTAFNVATMSFSRDDEASADQGAIGMLDRAGIRRDGMSDFFARLAEEEGDVPDWLSTHPASGERAEAVLAGAPAGAKNLPPSLNEADWASLAGACTDTDAPVMDLSELFF